MTGENEPGKDCGDRSRGQRAPSAHPCISRAPSAPVPPAAARDATAPSTLAPAATPAPLWLRRSREQALRLTALAAPGVCVSAGRTAAAAAPSPLPPPPGQLRRLPRPPPQPRCSASLLAATHPHSPLRPGRQPLPGCRGCQLKLGVYRCSRRLHLDRVQPPDLSTLRPPVLANLPGFWLGCTGTFQGMPFVCLFGSGGRSDSTHSTFF